MRRKRKIRRLLYTALPKATFFASEMRQMIAAMMTIGFRDKDDKLIAHFDIWEDPKGHGEIVRWLDGRYYFRTYRDIFAKPYTMTLAKLKYLKGRLA